MKITKLIIENFLTIGKIEANLSDRGLVLIQGQNVDDTSQNSNGSGKSSFPDALSWCLYGETARGQSGDAVVNDTAGKACRVLVEIEDGSERFTVARHRKYPKLKNKLTVTKHTDEGDVDLTKGTDKLTQPIVDKIVGCSADVFNAAIYSGQEKMPDLPGMTDKSLKTLVEESAGVNELQEAFAIANGRLRDARHELDAVDSAVDKQRSLSETLVSTCEIVNEQRRLWHKDNEAEVKRLTKELSDQIAVAKKSKALADVAIERIAKLEAAKVKLKAKVDGVAGEQDELRRLESVVSDTKIGWSNADRNMKEAQRAYERACNAVKEVDMLVGHPCTDCGKPRTKDDIAETRQRREESRDKCKVDKSEKEKLKKQYDLDLEKAQKAVDEYRASMTDISDTSDKIDKVSDAIYELKHKVKDRDEAIKLANDCKICLDGVKALENPHAKTYDDTKEKLESSDAKIAELEADQDARRADVVIKESVAKIMSPAGVRAHILDTVTPFLNARTAQYLGALTDGNITAVWQTISLTAKGEAREKFKIDVESAVGAKDFRGLSGGEKRKVRLACSMALQDLVASRATKPIDLYIADEIDDALDDSGLERLMNILHDKARERGTVLVISHNSLSDWISESVCITKEGGQSTMSGAALA